jgi:hypothetical protein
MKHQKFDILMLFLEQTKYFKKFKRNQLLKWFISNDSQTKILIKT